ncbi:MAG: sigma-70 family RNA polymerase sigma factor [Bacteroidota bacterium]
MSPLLQEWYRQFGPSLQAFLTQKVGEEAEDILHELFEKLHHKEAQLHQVKDARKWLHTAAKRAAIDHFRKQTTAANRKAKRFQVESLSSDHKVANCLYSFIPTLSKREQDLLLAVDIAGIGQKELAEEEGIPYSSMKSQVQRARKKLRKTFESNCEITYDVLHRPVDCERSCTVCA